MRRVEDIRSLNALHPDFIGYIFFPPSPRYVGDQPDPDIFMLADPDIIKTGVFVNAETANILSLAGRYKLDAIQLHGDETPRQCRELRDEGLILIKALGGGKDTKFPAQAYRGTVDYLLWDSSSEAYGGTGRKFDWSLIDESSEIPFLLSGGIGPGDAVQLNKNNFRTIAGVDVNSRFESSPGVKDIGQLEIFINTIRNGR